MIQGREYHTHQNSSNGTGDRESEGDNTGGTRSLKDPPSLHLRDDMAKRRVKTFDGYKVMECAMTWKEFERKYGQSS